MPLAHTLRHPSRFSLNEAVSTLIANLRAKHARRQEYLRVLGELNQMTDRELADLNLSRLSIRDVAYEAAYGA